MINQVIIHNLIKALLIFNNFNKIDY